MMMMTYFPKNVFPPTLVNLPMISLIYVYFAFLWLWPWCTYASYNARTGRRCF